MRIGFRDAKAQRLFNDHALLAARYGEALAAKIAIRLAVLDAARHLGLVPRHPPVRLGRVDGSPAIFTVDLAQGRRLRLRAVGARAADGERCDPAGVEEVEVLGVD